jgi:hypothetical protein
MILFHNIAFGQNELSRLTNETLWYNLEEELASCNLILASQNCDLSLQSGAKSKGYDGAATFALYDAVKDTESSIDLLYKIDTYGQRVELYSNDNYRLMLFYVKFRNSKAYLYYLQRDSGTYTLGKILSYFDVQAHLNSR